MTDWDKRFIDLAAHYSSWSKDPSTKCGAVIVRDREELGRGYNGFPRGVRDLAHRYADRDMKYRLVVHAEANAIVNASASIQGATIYVWPVSPCAECTKLIIQSGIRRVVAPKGSDEFNNRWADSMFASRLMMREAGVYFDEY